MHNQRSLSGTPVLDEWSPFHLGYLAAYLPGVADSAALPSNLRGREDDAYSFLEIQLRDFEGLVAEIPSDREEFRYAPGKWSVRQMVGHLSDTERILTWRSLAAARGDRTNIEPFEEDAYANSSGHDSIPLAHLVSELVSVRRSTLALYSALPKEAWSRRGMSNRHPVSARAWAFAIGCHAELHLNTLRTRYLA